MHSPDVRLRHGVDDVEPFAFLDSAVDIDKAVIRQILMYASETLEQPADAHNASSRETELAKCVAKVRCVRPPVGSD